MGEGKQKRQKKERKENPWKWFFDEFEKREVVITVRDKMEPDRPGAIGHVRVKNATQKFLKRLKVLPRTTSSAPVIPQVFEVNLQGPGECDLPVALQFEGELRAIEVEAHLTDDAANENVIVPVPQVVKEVPDPELPIDEVVVVVFREDGPPREPVVYCVDVLTLP